MTDLTPAEPWDPDAPCPHCPDGHQRPDRRPWAAWVTADRDGDGQPITIHVGRTDCAHVAESDAQWIRDVLNGRACTQHPAYPEPAP